MNTFSVGDVVKFDDDKQAIIRKLTSSDYGDAYLQVERFDGVSGGGDLYNGKSLYYVTPDSVTLVHISQSTVKGGEHPMIKRELSQIQKDSLDADTQVLVEEGILDGCLEVNNMNFIYSFLLRKFKPEMAEEIRKNRKEEEKKNKSK